MSQSGNRHYFPTHSFHISKAMLSEFIFLSKFASYIEELKVIEGHDFMTKKILSLQSPNFIYS
jgi:hypothetical protein